MNDIRRYAKTPRAWEALARPDLVGRQAHTLLLMANGRRSMQELSLLLGEDMAPLAKRLLLQGLLHEVVTPPPVVEVDDDALTGV